MTSFEFKSYYYFGSVTASIFYTEDGNNVLLQKLYDYKVF
jgi:hypothetical protein